MVFNKMLKTVVENSLLQLKSVENPVEIVENYGNFKSLRNVENQLCLKKRTSNVWNFHVIA